MLLNAVCPHEPFNTLIRKGEAGRILARILDDLKPEAVYFTEHNGHRTATLVIDVESASDIPKFSEPFFLHFEADCEFRIAMTPDDLAQAGLDKLGEKWA
jgi:hypothetical protein